MSSISRHVSYLARYVHLSLASYRHANGAPVATLYGPAGPWTENTRGGIVNFTLNTGEGECVGYTQVERVCAVYNVHVRTGCVCNPGACQLALGITSDVLEQQHLSGHVCGDATDLVDGRPTGSVRVSFGFSSTYEDADRILLLVRECFVEGPLKVETGWLKEEVKEVEEGCQREVHSPAVVQAAGKLKDGKPNNHSQNIDLLKSVAPSKLEIKRKDEISQQITRRSAAYHEKQISETQSNDLHHHLLEKKKSAKEVALALVANCKLDNTFLSSNAPSILPPFCPDHCLVLSDIVLYPVKSCGGVAVPSWPLADDGGLLYDRRWMVVSGAGYSVTLKRQPGMTTIQPGVDREQGILTLSCTGHGSVSVPLDYNDETLISPDGRETTLPCSARVCGDRVQGKDCGEEVAAWLCEVLQVEGLRLLRQTGRRGGAKRRHWPSAWTGAQSLANEAPLLLLHRPSVRYLLGRVESEEITWRSEEEMLQRFRGNLVLDGGSEFEEDTWTTLRSGSHVLQVSSPCSRCEMISVSPYTGLRTPEPLLSLGVVRSKQGKTLTFGVLASIESESRESGGMLTVGMLFEPRGQRGEDGVVKVEDVLGSRERDVSWGRWGVAVRVLAWLGLLVIIINLLYTKHAEF